MEKMSCDDAGPERELEIYSEIYMPPVLRDALVNQQDMASADQEQTECVEAPQVERIKRKLSRCLQKLVRTKGLALEPQKYLIHE